VREVGVGQCNIASILLLFVPTPCEEMIWPKYSNSGCAKEHLEALRNN